MKKIAFAFLCFVTVAANAQTIFQAQEVNKAATPQGAITSRNGKPVRQAFNYSVVFPDNPITNYDSTLHSLIDYFNDKFQYTQEPEVNR